MCDRWHQYQRRRNSRTEARTLPKSSLSDSRNSRMVGWSQACVDWQRPSLGSETCFSSCLCCSTKFLRGLRYRSQWAVTTCFVFAVFVLRVTLAIVVIRKWIFRGKLWVGFGADFAANLRRRVCSVCESVCAESFSYLEKSARPPPLARGLLKFRQIRRKEADSRVYVNTEVNLRSSQNNNNINSKKKKKKLLLETQTKTSGGSCCASSGERTPTTASSQQYLIF